MQAQDWWFAVLFFVTAFIVGCAALTYVLEIYRLFPEWGPIRKFDNDGNEDLRINQLLIHRRLEAGPDPDKKEEDDHMRNQLSTYGSVQPNLNDPKQQTWGHITAPWERREKQWDEHVGQMVTVRHAFCDTQYLRSHSAWWARDEPHFMQQAHITGDPKLKINDEGADLVRQRMVVDGEPPGPSMLGIAG